MMPSYMTFSLPLLQMKSHRMWEAKNHIHLEMDSQVTIKSKFLRRTCMRLLFLQNVDPTNIKSCHLG
jgi:hypothetical protein